MTIQRYSREILEPLFSKERLDSYASDEQHFTNFALIGLLSPKIGALEVIIRNRIDNILSQKDPKWIFHHEISQYLVGDYRNLEKHQIISKQNLGFWIKICDLYGIHSYIFKKDFITSLNFTSYYQGNKTKIAHLKLRDIQKSKAILYLLKIIRNRAFHFENLYKINKSYPRLNAKIMLGEKPLYIAITPHCIEKFLDDILGSFNATIAKDLMKVGNEDPLERNMIIPQNR